MNSIKKLLARMHDKRELGADMLPPVSPSWWWLMKLNAGLCLAFFLAGCAHHDFPVVTRHYPFVNVVNSETELATTQLHEADVAIDYENEKQIFLAVPPDFEHQTVANLTTLEQAVAHCTTNRELAVVTMGPAMRSLPQTEFDIKVDEVERTLQWIGFRRVAFHLGSTMRPIYRDETIE